MCASQRLFWKQFKNTTCNISLYIYVYTLSIYNSFEIHFRNRSHPKQTTNNESYQNLIWNKSKIPCNVEITFLYKNFYFIQKLLFYAKTFILCRNFYFNRNIYFMLKLSFYAETFISCWNFHFNKNMLRKTKLFKLNRADTRWLYSHIILKFYWLDQFK